MSNFSKDRARAPQCNSRNKCMSLWGVPPWLPQWTPCSASVFHPCQAFELPHQCAQVCRGWRVWSQPCPDSAGLSEREVVCHLKNCNNSYHLLLTVCQVLNWAFYMHYPIKSSQEPWEVGTLIILMLQIRKLSLEGFRSTVQGQQLM